MTDKILDLLLSPTPQSQELGIMYAKQFLSRKEVREIVMIVVRAKLESTIPEEPVQFDSTWRNINYAPHEIRLEISIFDVHARFRYAEKTIRDAARYTCYIDNGRAMNDAVGAWLDKEEVEPCYERAVKLICKSVLKHIYKHE